MPPRSIRNEQVGKYTLRLVEQGSEFAGTILGGAPFEPIRGNDAEQVWAKLRAEVGKASPAYFGYDGARARFLRLFPQGFDGAAFCTEERNYKVVAADYLSEHLPHDVAKKAGRPECEAAARAYSKTNLLSLFEQARTREVLLGPDGPAFLQAASALCDGETRTSLQAIEAIFKKHGSPSWPAATYLPYFWRPTAHMFLKPEVTKDFAERVGHRFARTYEPRLTASVYEDLLNLAHETQSKLSDLHPRDLIDVQSFIWIVGAYTEADAAALAKKA